MGRTTGGPSGGKAAPAKDGLGASLIELGGTPASSASGWTAALVVGDGKFRGGEFAELSTCGPDAESTGIDARACGVAMR